MDTQVLEDIRETRRLARANARRLRQLCRSHAAIAQLLTAATVSADASPVSTQLPLSAIVALADLANEIREKKRAKDAPVLRLIRRAEQ